MEKSVNGAANAGDAGASGSAKAPDLDDLLRQRAKLLREGAGVEGASRRALALSGGGIRSATFSLGVVQAIAEAQNDEDRGTDVLLLVPSMSSPTPSTSATSPAASTRSEVGAVFRSSLLSSFQYLSTVSGGGYLGAFLCSLFQPGRLRRIGRMAAEAPAQRKAVSPVSGMPQGAESAPADQTSAAQKQMMLRAADDAVRVLNRGVPQRIRSDADYSGDKVLDAPLAWLRENGRYLLPTGTGDGLYALALALRNWLSVHCVIGTVLVAVLAVLVFLRAEVALAWGFYNTWESSLLSMAVRAHETIAGMSTSQIWWSTLSVVCVVPLLTIGVVLGVAFWIVLEREDGTSAFLKNWAAWAMLGISVLSALLCWRLWPQKFMFAVTLDWIKFSLYDSEGVAEIRRMALVMYVSVVTMLAFVVFGLISLWGDGLASSQRVSLTRGLASTLVCSLVLAGLAVVDTIGQTLYLASFYGNPVVTTLSPAGLAAALVWFAKQLAKKDGIKLPSWLNKVPLFTLAGLGGIAIFVLVGSLWSMFVNWMVWGGNVPNVADLFTGRQADILLWVAGSMTLLAFINGFFPGFINLSSLQSFYGSRLTRAYLGASNGARFTSDLSARSAAEPLAGDQLVMQDYCDKGRIKTLAPVHIINVTVNKTVDPAEQLVQRDRKGQPLAVMPCGIALDSPNIVDFPAGQSATLTSVARPLSVGQWIGTSGAAFSTGIGRETSLGMSLLMGAANVRLGTWWPTGLGEPGTGKIPFWIGTASAPMWLRKVAGQLFKTQRYLSYELRASFYGTHRAWQYLSDGGHFENTAVYELLRTERCVEQIFASDNGADPDYQFDDLGNLIRLAKIDLSTDVRVASPPQTGPLAGLFGLPEEFTSFAKPKIDAVRGVTVEPVAAPAAAGSLVPGSAQVAAVAKPQGPCALLLYATRKDGTVIQIVMIKPFLSRGIPADVRQYAVNHPTFPQETTADQFFDEAQWESYRALGYHQAKRVFTLEVLKALREHAVGRIGTVDDI